MCTPVNSEDDKEHPKYTEFRAKVDMPNPVFKKGMLFSDYNEFKMDVCERPRPQPVFYKCWAKPT